MNPLVRTLKRYLVPATVSLIVTFGLWLYSGDSMLALIVGLLTNLTLLVVEHFNIVRRVSRFLDAHSGMMEPPAVVVSAATKLRSIENNGSSLQRWLAVQAFQRLESNLAQLAGGRWALQSVEGFVQLAEKLFDREFCRQEYRGTSVASDYRAYWPSALGRRFLKVTSDAIARGVVVKRVFIFDQPEERRELEPVMRMQAGMGVEVRHLQRGDVPAGVATMDFGIWDSAVAVLLSEAHNDGAAFRATVHLGDSEVKRLIENFEHLFEAATPFVANDPALAGGSGPAAAKT